MIPSKLQETHYGHSQLSLRGVIVVERPTLKHIQLFTWPQGHQVGRMTPRGQCVYRQRGQQAKRWVIFNGEIEANPREC